MPVPITSANFGDLIDKRVTKIFYEEYEQLPDRLRQYIAEREGQYATGVSTYKNQWDSARPIVEAVQPFMQDLQQHGIAPDQWIRNLGTAHKTLAMGSPEQKLQMFAKLATEYGVPLQALTGQQVDPQFSHLATELSQVKTQLQQFQSAQEQQAQLAMQAEIKQFASTAPHFEAVKPLMSQLLQSGVVTTLQDAYNKAIRLNDEVWNQHQAEQAKAAEVKRQEEIAAKKAKAVSPRSASPTGSMNTSGGKKGLREQLEESFAQAGSII